MANNHPINIIHYTQNPKGEKAGFSALEEFNYKIVDLKTDIFDKVSVATFVLEYDIKMQGAKMVAKSRVTLVFVNDVGKWRITNEHFSGFKPSF